jgi:hypothetical protein
VAVQVLDLGFQLDRVDGSHAGTLSCLKFCWVDAGRSARAMSGIDGRAGQGTGERRGSWPAGRDARSGRQGVSTSMVTGTRLVMAS